MEVVSNDLASAEERNLGSESLCGPQTLQFREREETEKQVDPSAPRDHEEEATDPTIEEARLSASQRWGRAELHAEQYRMVHSQDELDRTATKGEQNLNEMFGLADSIDFREGIKAYPRYHELLTRISEQYIFPFERTVAAFSALSPNNDYVGNLRSLLTLMHGIKEQVPCNRINVSTYGHCRDRAYTYLIGRNSFLETVRGLKIRSFYHNIMHPFDNRYVTIDGHMKAAWLGEQLTMKEAIIRSDREYNSIADACKRLAFRHFILPNQLQATIWFTRKRIFNVKYDPQIDLFAAADNDVWRTIRDLSELPLFPFKEQP